MAQVRISPLRRFSVLPCSLLITTLVYFSDLLLALMKLSFQVAPSDTSYGRCVRSYRVLLFPCCFPAPVLQPTVTR